KSTVIQLLHPINPNHCRWQAGEVDISDFHRSKYSNRIGADSISGYDNNDSQERHRNVKYKRHDLFESEPNVTEIFYSGIMKTIVTKIHNKFKQRNNRTVPSNQDTSSNNFAYKHDDSYTGYYRLWYRDCPRRGNNHFLRQENRQWTYIYQKRQFYLLIGFDLHQLKDDGIMVVIISSLNMFSFFFVNSIKNGLFSSSDDKTIRIWDVASGKQIQNFRGHSAFIFYAEFSPDGNTIVSCSYDKTIRLWDAKSGREIMQLKGHSSFSMHASFSSDGKYIASGSADNTVRLWDANSGNEIQRFDGHLKNICDVQFSPNSQMLLSASADNIIILWDIKSGKQLKQFIGHSNVICSAKFSPCSRFIVSCSYDKTIRIWNVESGKEMNTLTEFFVANDVKYFPDGQMLASCSCDSLLYLWDVNTGHKVHELRENSRVVTSVDISSDGNLLVSSSCDKTIQIWE
ncbi:WD-40 repeat protein, partial [Reticulomyxa filosa]